MKNEKSLENQIKVLGEKLKEKEISNFIKNLIVYTIKCYCDYQNNSMKHNDKINEFEVKFIIEQTCVFINFIVNTLGS